MRVAYFPNSCALNSIPVMQAMLNSLRSAGHTVVENSLDCDAAIIWSVLWTGHMRSNKEIWAAYRETNRPVIIVEVGALYRGETWKIAINSITADGQYAHQENLDWNRPQKLGIGLALNLSRNPRIIIASQHALSLQVAGLSSMEDWVIDQIQQLRTVTDRPITIRSHPRSKLNSSKVGHVAKDITIEQPVRLPNTYDSYNLTFDCHALVNYNSGPGIQAALAGTRPLVDRTSLAYPVSIKLADIDQPYIIDRDQWLVEICHTEYRLNEIEQGLWLKRLEQYL